MIHLWRSFHPWSVIMTSQHSLVRRWLTIINDSNSDPENVPTIIPGSGRLLLCQGQSPTCLPVSAAMVLDTMGIKYSPEIYNSLTKQLSDEDLCYMRPIAQRLGQHLKGLYHITISGDSNMIPNSAVQAEQIRNVTHSCPAICTLQIISADEDSRGSQDPYYHAVVVDRVTQIDRDYVFLGRNPWGSRFTVYSNDMSCLFPGNSVYLTNEIMYFTEWSIIDWFKGII